MAKKTKKADAAQADATTTNETANETTVEQQPETAVATEAAPEPEPPKKSRKGPRYRISLSPTATLGQVALGYIQHMEDDGKSDGTIASYRMELKTATAHLGDETRIVDITPEKVQAFFSSKKVTKLRSGKNKSQLSVDKTRRVLRLCLVWAAERGIIDTAPIPEVETKF